MNPEEMYIVFDACECEHRGVATGAVLIQKYPRAANYGTGKIFRLLGPASGSLLAVAVNAKPFEAN